MIDLNRAFEFPASLALAPKINSFLDSQLLTGVLRASTKTVAPVVGACEHAGQDQLRSPGTARLPRRLCSQLIKATRIASSGTILGSGVTVTEKFT